jgi:hypothetical protein
VKRAVLIGLALTCLARASYAWLEATEKQCEERYGNPTAQQPTLGSDKTLSYRKDDVRITADFVKGICLRISYATPSWTTQSEIDTFFKVNGGPMVWIHRKGGGGGDYARTDRFAKATVEMGLGGGVTFTAYDWEKAHEQAIEDVETAKQAAEKERLKKLEHDF